MIIVNPTVAEEIAKTTVAVEEREAGIMEHIMKDGTYDLPWVQEKLRKISCEFHLICEKGPPPLFPHTRK